MIVKVHIRRLCQLRLASSSLCSLISFQLSLAGVASVLIPHFHPYFFLELFSMTQKTMRTHFSHPLLAFFRFLASAAAFLVQRTLTLGKGCGITGLFFFYAVISSLQSASSEGKRQFFSAMPARDTKTPSADSYPSLAHCSSYKSCCPQQWSAASPHGDSCRKCRA